MGATALADNAYLKRRCGKQRSGFRWYVRVPVPTDIQDTIRKQTIERALNTSDIKEARRLKLPVLTEIFESFERARGGRITSADIEHEAQRYLRQRLEQITQPPDDTFVMLTDSNGNDLGLCGDNALAILLEELEQEEWSGKVVEEADKVARQYGVVLSQPQRDELCHALQSAEIQALSRVLAIHKGEVPEPIRILNARAVDPVTANVPPRHLLAPRPGKGMRASEAAEAYLNDRNRQRRSALTGQTTNQSRATLRMFAEYTRDAPLASITRNDVASFLSTLARIDPSYGRRSSANKMTFDALLEKYPARSGHGLGDKTLNRHAAIIAGMFDWAIASGDIEGPNPARGHRRSTGENWADNESARRPFTTDELNKLFGGPLFAISFSERAQPKHHTVETALAWLIPIALFSGMRLDEICGLRVTDILDDDRLRYFDLCSHVGRRLKTAAARRRVPVHAELDRIGFGVYLAHVRGQGHEYLFPALKPGGPDGKRSWYVSKRFTTYRRAVGVGGSSTVFHCFRKNAATALERAHVPENEAVQVLGHKRMTMSYGLYSGGLDLPGLARVVGAITFPGLGIFHLQAPSQELASSQRSEAAAR